MPSDESARDRQLYAVFREETSIGVGDPYKNPDPLPERFKGKQFGVPFQAKGKGPDAMIDKSLQLTTQGDRYVDQHQVHKILSKGIGGAAVTDKPFVPSRPCPKGSGMGSMYGLLSPPLLDTDPSAAAKTSRAASDSAAGKRKIYANPAKLGTYGFPWQDRTIGGTKFEHVPDEYAPGNAISRRLKAEARARIPKPFVSMGRVNQGIQPIINYSNAAGPDTKPGSPTANNLHSKQWRPNNPPQMGHGDFGCINKLKYVPTTFHKEPPKLHEKPFIPPANPYNRLSMRSVNPYSYEAFPPKDNDFTLLS